METIIENEEIVNITLDKFKDIICNYVSELYPESYYVQFFADPSSEEGDAPETLGIGISRTDAILEAIIFGAFETDEGFEYAVSFEGFSNENGESYESVPVIHSSHDVNAINNISMLYDVYMKMWIEEHNKDEQSRDNPDIN